MAEDKELKDYRMRLLDRFEQASAEFCTACRAVSSPHAPMVEGGWNVHQLAAHVWDVDLQAYGQRMRRILAEDHPSFENYDADAWFASRYDASVPLETMLREFEARMAEIIPVLRNLPPEAWNRIGQHQVQGDLSLQTWVERGLAHVEEHLASVRSAGA